MSGTRSVRQKDDKEGVISCVIRIMEWISPREVDFSKMETISNL